MSCLRYFGGFVLDDLLLWPARFFSCDFDRLAVLVVKMIFSIVEVPFSAFFIALVAALPVGLAGMAIRRERDDDRQEEGKIHFEDPSR